VGRGLSTLQQDIMKHVQEKGRILPRQALDLAFTCGEFLSGNEWHVAKSVASQALRRLVKRGLLKRHRARFVGWQNFYHLATVEPVERDQFGRTEDERQRFFAECKAKHDTKSLLDAEDEIRQAFAAMAGKG